MPQDTAPLTLVTVPCRTDNYAFLLHDEASGATALVDAPEAAPIQAELDRRGWTLSDILITHHHDDHVDGLAALRGEARVIGAAADAHRLPPLDLAVAPGGALDVLGQETQIIDVPGHTVGHIAFYIPDSGLLFTGDSLMALGCGRLFEGSPAQMWDSLSRLAQLPPETQVCSGHEYTRANGRFALSVDGGNAALHRRVAEVAAAREAGRPTVPSLLQQELETNPFLRAGDPELRRSAGIAQMSPEEAFAELRRRKDSF
ncbi:hydroxyacylglutathione hydrolase [Pseudoroseicyclus aestuarii]|uniref:Hydroxyacylglutathione hydrolase n=1 Tax=Pseudoroseicyclus aestuarii TaxID=1795041 RepID=A0A318SPX7_9RHOB|nr:hydroxyacylglutathione hydrolase [Pseudoroseicyclus aestuarii]PYE82398.1 hydroxyacylglutathione hydrolase [Pseudoroseicyclus aestuarii]